MGVAGNVWSAFKSIIQLEDRVKAQAAASKEQQQKIQDLTGRVIRLETQIEMLTMAAFGARSADAVPRTANLNHQPARLEAPDDQADR